MTGATRKGKKKNISNAKANAKIGEAASDVIPRLSENKKKFLFRGGRT